MSWLYEIGVAKYFTQSKQETNAKEFYKFFINDGCTLESICGILGNIQRESTLNPGIKQGASTSLGWGLIQWAPSTVLTKWCKANSLNWWDGTAQCELIKAEGEGNRGAAGYWLPTKDYPYTWAEFKNLTSVEESTKAYLYERERAGVEELEERISNAKKWYEFFIGTPPDPDPDPPTPPQPFKKKKMPLYMYSRRF